MSTKKINCIKNKKTLRCRKSLKQNKSSGNCVYSKSTDRCRNVKDEKYVTYSIEKDEYKVSPSVKKWLTSLEKSKKIANNFKNHPDELTYMLDEFKSLNKYKNLNEYVIHDLLELSSNHARDDENNVNDIIQMKDVKFVIKLNEEISFAIYGKYED